MIEKNILEAHRIIENVCTKLYKPRTLDILRQVEAVKTLLEDVIMELTSEGKILWMKKNDIEGRVRKGGGEA